MQQVMTETSTTKVASRTRLAGIQYRGIAGGSQDCQCAVEELLQCGERITLARILTHGRHHALLLTTDIGDRIVVKSGFATGYSGEGPRRFSYILQLLSRFGAEIHEHEVRKDLLDRADFSALTLRDLDLIDRTPPIRPSRWPEFIQQVHFDRDLDGELLQEMPAVVPFSIIDSRICDLAVKFWKDTDSALMDAYRRLEDAVRLRSGLSEHGSKLFSKTFGGENPLLYWQGINETERSGRLNLFTGAYMAHRNPRAHKELHQGSFDQLSEFLVLNHLFRLEAVAIVASA